MSKKKNDLALQKIRSSEAQNKDYTIEEDESIIPISKYSDSNFFHEPRLRIKINELNPETNNESETETKLIPHRKKKNIRKGTIDIMTKKISDCDDTQSTEREIYFIKDENHRNIPQIFPSLGVTLQKRNVVVDDFVKNRNSDNTVNLMYKEPKKPTQHNRQSNFARLKGRYIKSFSNV